MNHENWWFALATRGRPDTFSTESHFQARITCSLHRLLAANVPPLGSSRPEGERKWLTAWLIHQPYHDHTLPPAVSSTVYRDMALLLLLPQWALPCLQAPLSRGESGKPAYQEQSCDTKPGKQIPNMSIQRPDALCGDVGNHGLLVRREVIAGSKRMALIIDRHDEQRV